MHQKFQKVVCFGVCLWLWSCNSTDGNRFSEQEGYDLFASNSSTLKAFGASRIERESDRVFRCPSVSGMGSETSLTVFKAKAHGAMPHFTLDTIPGIRSDAQGGIGISLEGLPVGVLDIYEKCHASSYEKLTTACPPHYDIVETCSSAHLDKEECRLIHRGTHRLVVSAQVNNDESCLTEEMDRSPYPTSAPDVSKACDAFSPIEVLAAYRMTQPSDHCCNAEDSGTLDFCFKPCGCRTLSVGLEPKPEWLEETADAQDKDILRIGVFSNVEGNTEAFQQLLESMGQKNIDVAISLGNLTKNGSKDEFSQMRALIDEQFLWIDGTPKMTDACVEQQGNICCSEDRQFENNICNAIVRKVAFHASLGENEYKGGGLTEFFDRFGPSRMATTIGKVQLIMLDTADASFGEAQTQWLESVLSSTQTSTCQIPAPEGEQWPTLAECRGILGIGNSNTKKLTCRECIGQEAYCIPPDAERSNPDLGPENCVCVPLSSKVCPQAQTCARMDGTEADCICTRDEDCGYAGSCVEGKCHEPVRFVFSYTPIFDEFGSRNNALANKSEAAALMSLLTKARVNAVFSGRILDYAHFTMGKIPIYITGGGGADMASFARKKHHWLYIEVPKAYSRPDPNHISIQVVEFE